jgi:hypothetical protein
MRAVRASEIGSYLYCHRSWWYQQRGEPSQNQAEMVHGVALHEQHRRSVLAAGCLQVAAYGLLLLSLLLITIYLTRLFL